jgi:tetratricopeptide (TPR) repeat protein
MARRVQIQLIVLTLLLAPVASAQLNSSNLLVNYSFDDGELASGPDTFAVFAHARGTVTLSSTSHLSGYRSVEIRDVAGDGDFPELQGYFPPRDKGKLFLHFALMTATPDEELNIALAGPEWFTLRKNGIGFWLKTQGGYLYQVSDSMPKKLFLLDPFVWYVANVAYDIDHGVYDLVIHKEGLPKPVVSLTQQVNAPNQPGSAADKFSFIGDKGEDTSNVAYYVDDVVVGIDEAIIQLPFVAPGRRKLFIDYWNDSQRQLRSKPGPMEVMALSDLGIRSKEVETLRREGLWDLLLQLISGRKHRADIPDGVSVESSQLLQAVGLWSDGCEDMKKGEVRVALAGFEKADQLVPSGKIYGMDAVLALAALGQWQEADLRLSRVYSEWQGDLRLPVALAKIGMARQNLDVAEQWLRGAADQVPDEIGQGLLHRLRSGELNETMLEALRTRFPEKGADYVRDVLIAEEYFFVLLWKDQAPQAEQFAQRMVARYQTLGIPSSKWLERLGDASFLMGNFPVALERYEESLRDDQGNTGILKKLSDVHFRLGDLERERFYREKIYGRLSQE